MNHLVGNRAKHGLELVDGEELQVGVRVGGAAAFGPSRAADGVLARPFAVDGVLEDREEEGDDVADCLGARPALSIAVATASICAVVTFSSGRSPRRGVMWTRCIDSQPTR